MRNFHWSMALLLLLLISSLPAIFIERLQINNAPEVYFPLTLPSVAFERQLREDFPQDQVLVALFNLNVADDDYIEKLDSFSQELGDHELVERVLSITTVDHISGSDDGWGT